MPNATDASEVTAGGDFPEMFTEFNLAGLTE
jgi:hypothetical protein